MKNNRSNGTRSGRSHKGNSKLERIYYIVIGILLIVLLGLIVFIFSDRGGNTTDISENPSPGSDLVNDTEEDTEEDPEEESPAETDAEEDTETEENDVVDEEEENGEETSEDLEETDEDQEVSEEEQNSQDEENDTDEEYEVAEDAPLDTSYSTDFSDGSSDRAAIAQAISQTTGLNQNDMIEWWVGNNGPGRVEATVSSSDRSQIYRVLLQYGEGSWHVTNVEELSELP